MAAPNIVAVANIYGKTAVANITTSATAFVTNSPASGEVYKINSLYVSNIDGTVSADLSLDLFRSSVAYHLTSTLVVPADTSIDVLTKTIYLEEGDSLRCTASVNGDLQLICSYEIIS